MSRVKIPGPLIRDISHHSPAIFLGAGASVCRILSENERMPLGNQIIKKLLVELYPGESQSLDELKRKFQDEFKTKVITPEIVWSKVLDVGKNLLPYNKILDELFDSTKPVPPNYKFIARLCLRNVISTILTTNFDEKIEDAFKRIMRYEATGVTKFYSATDDDDFNFYKEAHHKTDMKVIYKLHGTLSRPHTIRSSSDELDKLSEDKSNVFKDIVEHNTIIIFIGYSCQDDDIYKALLKIAEEKTNPTKIWWISKEKTENVDRVLEKFNSKDNFIRLDSYDFLDGLNKNFCSDEIPPSQAEIPERDFLVKECNPKIIKSMSQSKEIYDPVLGTIGFDKDCVEPIFTLINSADIQRLRDVKQLSFVHYHYPGATHSRFHHSIGVAYLVSKALQKLGCDLDTIRDTVYAAILHDVGHGPFSHVAEMFFEKIGRSYEHEKFTLEFIQHGLLDLSTIMNKIPTTRDKVEDIIYYTLKSEEENYPEDVYLSWLVGDYVLDFDRVDFLLRDFYYTGCPDLVKASNGDIWDPSSLEGRIKIIETLTEAVEIGTLPEYGNVKLLCFNEDVKPLIDCFLDLYVNMYLKIFYSSTDLCARAMIVKALEIAYKFGDINPIDLYRYTDSEMFSFLQNADNEIVRKLTWSVKYRRFFKPLLDFKPEPGITAGAIEKAIIKKMGVTEEDIDSLVLISIPQSKSTKKLFLKDKKGNIKKEDTSHYFNQINEMRRGYIFASWRSKFIERDSVNQIADILTDKGIKDFNRL